MPQPATIWDVFPVTYFPHLKVESWTDLVWTDRHGVFGRCAAFKHRGQEVRIFELAGFEPPKYWIVVDENHVSMKGRFNPKSFDTVEAACWLYTFLHPEEKEP